MMRGLKSIIFFTASIWLIACDHANNNKRKSTFETVVSKLFLNADMHADSEQYLRYFRTHKDVKPLGVMGWISYPPLSALGDAKDNVLDDTVLRKRARIFALPAYEQYQTLTHPVLYVGNPDSVNASSVALSVGLVFSSQDALDLFIARIQKELENIPYAIGQYKMENSTFKTISFNDERDYKLVFRIDDQSPFSLYSLSVDFVQPVNMHK